MLDWRVAVGAAWLALYAWAVLWTELLSLGGWLTPGPLVAVWAVPLVAALAWLRRTRPRPSLQWWTTSTGLERAAFAVIGACLVATLLVALVAAPNNWDSMTYHLARVEMWHQLGAVRHYATHIEPQLYQPPGAEILIAQSYILTGGSDVFAALVQWFAYVVCIATGSFAAAALGANRRTQLGAALLVATVPLAMLQASSTQNDLVLAAALLVATTFALHAWRAPRSVTLLLIASLAIGLAVLTKGTGLLFGLPVGVLVAGVAIHRLGLVRTLPLAAAGLVLVAAPNAGQWARNHDTYGAFIASEHAGIDNPYRVQDPNAASLVSNLVRNATNHLDLPGDPANDRIERWTVGSLDAVGIDANDPKTTFLQQPFRVGPFGPHEDHAGSLLLLVLGIWAAASTLRSRDRRQLAWLAVLAGQVLLFCWLITWQNWHVRMHLPLTITAAVLVAVRLGSIQRRWPLVAACAVAATLAPIYLLANVTRPVIGSDSILTSSRAATRFQPRPQLREPYAEVVARIESADIEAVGLLTGIDDWQYPLLTAFDGLDIDVTQVHVPGPSRMHATDTRPDAAVCVSCQSPQHQALAADGLEPVELAAGGPRTGRGDDVTTVELWVR